MNFLALFSVRRLRLASGLVMFAYITMHLSNHMLGLISLDAAEHGLDFVMATWRHPVMTFLLYSSAALHFVLALWTLYSRHEWHLPWVEQLRLFSGFSFPLLLIQHAVTARLGDAFYGIAPSYAEVVGTLLAAGRQGLQLALLAPGWLHGCLGLWITLRRYDIMRRIKVPLTVLVFLIPVLAAGGFIRMAAEVSTLPPAPASPDLVTQHAALDALTDDLTKAYLGAVAVAFLLGRLRALVERRRSV